MKENVSVFLAEGFEEIEGLTVVDLLRRAEIEVTMVSIGEGLEICGAHGIKVLADTIFEGTNFEETSMLILPGGIPGTPNLEKHEGLMALIKEFDKEKKKIAAICAAPGILARLGLLKDKEAISYPSVESELCGAKVLREPVVVSGHLITSRAVGTAIDFALKLIEILKDEETAKRIAKAIVYKE